MTTRDFTANVISATKVVPDGNFKTSKASGVWDINEALDLIKGGNWPNAANIDPAAFVDGVFSSFVYQGDGQSNRDIVNNINLSDKGGLVWLKTRGTSYNHFLNNPGEFTGYAQLPSTNAWTTSGNFVTFNNDGFRIPVAYSGANATNSTQSMVAWTFRKQPKFFDIVTYNSSSGNVTNFGSAGATVDHNLGSVPGMIIVKCTDTGSTNWKVYHRGLNGGTNPEEYEIELNQNGQEANSANSWNDTAPTSTQFTLGSSGDVNNGSRSYVAYLFAHNDDDGGFGEPGDQDIIKCGSFSTDGSGNATVNLGFEPQWLMVKPTNQNYNWEIYDNKRGFGVNGHNILIPNLSNAEGSNTTAGNTQPTSTGFSIGGGYWGNNVDLIYMAIRRGGMQTPSAASDVFALGTRGASTPGFTSNFPVDMFIRRYTTGSGYPDIGSRLTGAKAMQTSENFAEGNDSSSTLDHMTGYYTSSSADSNQYSYMWKRARGYFDVVTYFPTSTSNQTITHNLGVKPEMVWIKQREAISSTNRHWAVGMPDILGINNNTLSLNNTYANGTLNYNMFTQQPTATQFVLHGNENGISSNGGKYIAYLFATAAGVSKVGSYSGNSGTQTIDCGFSSGASFLIIKAYSTTGGWFVWDSARGIVSGNDPYFLLHSTLADETGYDAIDPHSSGFTLNNVGAGTNDSGTDYIFYAIAATS